MNVQIRKAVREDLGELLHVLPQLTSRPNSVGASTPVYSEALTIFDEMLSHGNIVILIAVDRQDDSIVGSLTTVVVPNLTHGGRPWALIENVVIVNEHRGKGIGSFMVNHAFDVLKERGCYKVQIVGGNRGNQIRFYKRLGMDDLGCRGYKMYFHEA